MSEKIVFMQDKFKNGKTGEEVPGVTIIVDGKFRQVLDILIRKSDTCENYVQIIKEALFAGIDQMLNEEK